MGRSRNPNCRGSCRGFESSGRCGIFILCVGVVLFGPSRRDANAEPAEAVRQGLPLQSDESLPLIELQVIGNDAASDGLQQLLGIERRGKMRMHWSSAPAFHRRAILERLPAGRARIHCWIDFTEARMAHLYFVVPTLDRFMLRDFAFEQLGSFEFESIAQIVELSIDVLLTDEQAGMTRQQAQTLLNVPPLPAPRRAHALGDSVQLDRRERAPGTTRSGVRVGARYSAAWYSERIPVQHGPGVSIEIDRKFDTTLQTLAVSWSFYLPQRFHDQTASASVGYMPVALELGQLWTVDRSCHHLLGPRIAAGVALVRARAFAGELSGDYDLQPVARTPEPFVAPGFIWRVGLATRLSFETGISFNLVPKPVRHEFVVDGQARTLTEGLRLRPALSAALLAP